MNVKKKKNYRVALFVLFIFLVYSFAFYTGVKRTFPYSILSNVKQDIVKTLDKQKINLSKTDKADCSFNEIFYCFKLPQEIIFSNSSDLNNFILDWDQIEIKNLKKLAYLEFVDDKLFYLNQDDEKFLSKINLGEKNFDEVIHGGIKQIFKMNGKFYAYVGYRNENCALVSIFQYPNGEKITDFPCLPAKLDQVDLNGTGGAYLKFNNLNFLTVGTPTAANETIDNLAQQDDSPYGKVLTIDIDEENKFDYKIFSKGHRNPQGITSVHKKIFSVEHGPRGGDELNIIYENGNYGWPLYSLGSHYNLNEISKEGWSNENLFKGPLFSFVPSIGISVIEKCPHLYEEYYKPYKCIAIGSMRAQSIYLMLMNENLDKVINYEKIEFPSRIRKFKFYDDLLIAGTDFEGVIIGQIKKLNK